MLLEDAYDFLLPLLRLADQGPRNDATPSGDLAIPRHSSPRWEGPICERCTVDENGAFPILGSDKENIPDFVLPCSHRFSVFERENVR